jgi:hypothetical protein
MAQKQLACKIVDLRRRAKEPNESENIFNAENGPKVQAYAEQVREVTGVRKKLIREIEFLSRLSHVRDVFGLIPYCAKSCSPTLSLCTRRFVHHIPCE